MDIFNSIIEDFASCQVRRKQEEEERYLLDQGEAFEEPQFCYVCGDEIDVYDKKAFEFSFNDQRQKTTGSVCGLCADDPDTLESLNQFSNLKINK